MSGARSEAATLAAVLIAGHANMNFTRSVLVYLWGCGVPRPSLTCAKHSIVLDFPYCAVRLAHVIRALLCSDTSGYLRD